MYSFGKDFFDETEIKSLLEDFLKEQYKKQQVPVVEQQESTSRTNKIIKSD